MPWLVPLLLPLLLLLLSGPDARVHCPRSWVLLPAAHGLCQPSNGCSGALPGSSRVVLAGVLPVPAALLLFRARNPP